MKAITRRNFLKSTGLAAAATTLTPRLWPQVPGANSDMRIGIVGFNGRGKNLIADFDSLPGSRIVALCDVDTAVLDAGAKALRDKGREVQTFVDYRDLLAKGNVDAVAIATPNHQHALQAVWACQAGKDVYLEKPVSYDIWEGRKIIEAAQKYKRIVQTGSQARSSGAVSEAVAWTRAGNLGKILVARGLCYKRRDSIGLTQGPQPIPATVNYDLWLGPAPDAPLLRAKLHYEWHWQWPYGNGDVCNQGVHQMDIARWFLGQSAPPPRILSAGGRFGYIDDGQTPNTLLVWQDYGAVPLIFEVRGLPARAGVNTMDNMSGTSIGVIVQCENGTVVVPASYTAAQALDRDGKVVKAFSSSAPAHAKNFLAAVQSRKESDLNAPIVEGHVSAALAHAGNISYRVGKQMEPGAIREQIKGDAAMGEAFARMSEHLAANNVDLAKTPAALGAPLAFDTKAERFTNNDEANKLVTREYRKPFVVPDKV